MSRLDVIAAIARKSAKNKTLIRNAERRAKWRALELSLASSDCDAWPSIEHDSYAGEGIGHAPDSDE